MTTITLNTGGPADPAYVREVAEALAESVRVLAHLTRHPEALAGPADADRVLREISSAASRLPQVLDQVTARVGQMTAAGRITMDSSSRIRDPQLAADSVRLWCDRVSGDARRLAGALEAATAVTSAMTWEDDSDARPRT